MHATGAMSRIKLKLRFVVECRVDCIRRDDHKERVAVWRRSHDRPRSAILLPAPGRFSMTNCWPSRSDSP